MSGFLDFMKGHFQKTTHEKLCLAGLLIYENMTFERMINESLENSKWIEFKFLISDIDQPQLVKAAEELSVALVNLNSNWKIACLENNIEPYEYPHYLELRKLLGNACPIPDEDNPGSDLGAGR